VRGQRLGRHGGGSKGEFTADPTGCPVMNHVFAWAEEVDEVFMGA
jgi:hypothetical protein